jgi:hypothetical protein
MYTRKYDVTFQKFVVFIATVVKTSNPTTNTTVSQFINMDQSMNTSNRTESTFQSLNVTFARRE